jgi:peptide-methionine (S)-S-oxide reductase
MNRIVLLMTGLLTVSAAILTLFSCSESQEEYYPKTQTFCQMNTTPPAATLPTNTHFDTATFGTGCFWCTEAQFQQLNGVHLVESGYEGGTVEKPTYKQVCTGETGHAEVCRVVYDPAVISFDELLAAFWTMHDPTQLNRQGNDVGTQYRSVIFFHNELQQQKAELYKRKLNEEKAFNKPIVTEISPTATFYKAEDYHQNYFNENGSQPYCTFVIAPKLDKFRKVFAGKLKQ